MRFLLLLLVLFSAAAQAQPRISNIQRNSAREILLTLSGPTSEIYRYDISTNLNLWQPLYSYTNLTTSSTFTNVGAVYHPRQFYRAVSLPNTALTGDYLPTDDGDVIFHPVTHATFVIQWKNLIIYNDPSNYAPSAYPGIPKADLILISHSHGDHFNANALPALTNATTRIIAPQAVYNALSASLRNITTVLNNDQSAIAFGINIAAIPAYNANHARGTGNGYVLTIGGRRIYIAGDTGDIPEMRALQNIDAAFVPMNQFTMTIPAAASAVQAFRPRIVFPYHFSRQDLAPFKSGVGTNTQTEVRLRRWY